MREKFPLIIVALLILSLLFGSLLVLSAPSISFSPYLPSLYQTLLQNQMPSRLKKIKAQIIYILFYRR